MPNGHDQILEGLGAMVAGGALAVLRAVTGGGARSARREIKQLLVELKDDLTEVKTNLHDVHETLSQQREEVEGIRTDMRQHNESDDRRFNAIETRADRNHRDNSSRLQRIEDRVNKS